MKRGQNNIQRNLDQSINESSRSANTNSKIQLLDLGGLSNFDKMALSNRARQLLGTLLSENPELKEILTGSSQYAEVPEKIRQWVYPIIQNSPNALKLYRQEIYGLAMLQHVKQEEIAAIRILDYLDHSGRKFSDLNQRGMMIENDPFKFLWLGARFNRGGMHPNFLIDMIELFRQLNGTEDYTLPSETIVKTWMHRHTSGLNPEIQAIREKNRDRILGVFIRKMDKGEINDKKYFFKAGLDQEKKMQIARGWWNERLFHLRFAARDPQTVNELLDYSLTAETLANLEEASNRGIPIFVNPYYLSLLILNPPDHLTGADQPIRDYIFYSKQLLDEFGHIVAWEKEDEVEPGKPNAAGWILPNSYNIHRRYPEVAILIPDTVGRSCGGLCVSCQRMYDFQSGNLNFDLDKLKPKKSWWERLDSLMDYFENDAQLRDILITGGDALMSSDKSLKLILDAIYQMAVRKREANASRKAGDKYAEITRIRLGTRLPVYLPMRMTDELTAVLSEFKDKAEKIGIKQFVIQTHFESAMEVTPESAEGVRKLLSSGWIVTNQQVFTASASRRGHTAMLRKVLNDIGVLPYYTFTVKGYMENYHSFTPNCRSLQEQVEEKFLGKVPDELVGELKKLPEHATTLKEDLDKIRQEAGVPFLATDRNMLNLPAVGKSQTYRTIGITRYGRRILEFDHDSTRNHSPITKKMGKVVIIESKPVYEYLKQLKEMGEQISDYRGLFGYSLGFTEKRSPLYIYPEPEFTITNELTNFSDESY
jgi:lysine 2,3-aminomutase